VSYRTKCLKRNLFMVVAARWEACRKFLQSCAVIKISIRSLPRCGDGRRMMRPFSSIIVIRYKYGILPSPAGTSLPPFREGRSVHQAAFIFTDPTAPA